MRKRRKDKGFSLAEVLLAVCTLAVGMIFVAGVFPAGILFTTIATERTIAAVAADEAFAKIRLYGVDTSHPLFTFGFGLIPFEDVAFTPIGFSESAYPSTDELTQKRYYWSALCRRVPTGWDRGPWNKEGDATNLVQVTVFVCRKVGAGTVYWGWDVMNGQLVQPLDRPVPVRVSVSPFDTRELTIDNPDETTFINDGYTIVDDRTGRIYRVLERSRVDDTRILLDLDRDWGLDNVPPDEVWVVPPPVSGGRYPCIAVYQKVIDF